MRSVVVCVAHLMPPHVDPRLRILMDVMRVRAEMLGLTCILTNLKSRGVFVLIGEDDALDMMLQGLTKSRWLEGLRAVGERTAAPPHALRRSAVRPALWLREQAWLEQELTLHQPRMDTILALELGCAAGPGAQPSWRLGGRRPLPCPAA